ncbi:MAG: transcriptional repressor [Spirochaetales bacterium]|nr:transcriptional repressor [Spirochaetales bacterium]
MKQRRETRQRQIILEAVRGNCNHPSADQIYLELRASGDKISRGTVFRNLNCLSDDGEINRVKVPGADRYDCRLERHYHLICTSCDAVMDAPLDYQAELDQKIADATGFSITRHLTVFEGICLCCKGASKKAEGPHSEKK